MRSIRDVKSNSDMPKATDDGSLKDEMGALAAKYADKSESELMSALMQNVAAAKNDGSFSAEQLESFVGFVSPSLDEQSREKLTQLVKMIKEG